MKFTTLSRAMIFFLLGSWVFVTAGAAQTSAALSKAKQDAEAKGYIFETSHDAIVAKAKQEGKLVVLASQDQASINGALEVFRKKYPFIDVKATEIGGTDTYLRMIKEMVIGQANWDVNYVAFDFYKEYLPHQKKFDLLGMAKHGVLNMPPEMIDPDNPFVISLQSNVGAVAYNKKLLPESKVPKSYEDFLKPEFKGRKFATDVRPRALAALVPAWGLEKIVGYAKGLAAQQPIWTRGDSRTLPFVSGGEVPLILGLNYKSYMRFKNKRDPQDILGATVLQPVPVRLTEAEAILGKAKNPYAALLWLEFQASPEGQKVLDDTDLAASHLSPDSFHEKATRGKQLSVMGWADYENMGNYQKAIVKAFGFPRADKLKK